MDTRNWHAWLDKMPPNPNSFHVTGEICVSNAGIKAELAYKYPQGFNPEILFLELILIQQDGIWPQVMTWTNCRFDTLVSVQTPNYTHVEVFYQDTLLVKLTVEEVS